MKIGIVTIIDNVNYVNEKIYNKLVLENNVNIINEF